MKRLAQSNPTLQTPHYCGQFALSLGKESPNIFFKFNPLNTDTPLTRTLSMPPSVSVLTGLTMPPSLYASCHISHFGINRNLYLKPKVNLISRNLHISWFVTVYFSKALDFLLSCVHVLTKTTSSFQTWRS